MFSSMFQGSAKSSPSRYYGESYGGVAQTVKEPPVRRKTVDAIDLTMVKMKLCLPVEKDGKGWLQEVADEGERQYRMFLKLCLMFPEVEIVPTGLIDDMWHQHILDTEAYQQDCYAVFGKMLHHFPYFGLRGEEDAANLQRSFATTVALFQEHFGVDITLGDRAAGCNGNGGNGGGQGCGRKLVAGCNGSGGNGGGTGCGRHTTS